MANSGIEESPSKKVRHQQLAGVVKGVHAKLRKEFRQSSGNHDKVWNQHCQDSALLSEYADAMHQLATDIWTKHPETRIDWCRNTCLEYFFQGGLLKVFEKQKRRKRHERESSSAQNITSHSRSPTGRLITDAITINNPCQKENRNGLHGVECARGSVSGCVALGENGHNMAENSKAVNFVTKVEGACEMDSAIGASAEPADVAQNMVEWSCSDSNDESMCGTSPESDLIFGLPDGTLEDKKLAVHAKYGPIKYNTITLPFQGKIRLLDVGSCFNPFLQFEEFLAIGIDISPAVESVYHCDFLHLDVTEPLQLASDTIETFIHCLKSPIERLPSHSFHVIVFSLLLEYFPCAYQRWICCQRAQELLMVNGLLLIITPDSHHQNRNAPMMKSWKLAIESMGFARWRYVKQEHLHCMAFRKTVHEDTGHDLVGDTKPDMLYIPQDFHAVPEEKGDDYFFGSFSRSDIENEFLRENFNELPDLTDSV